MTIDEFATLRIEEKWRHIKQTMDYIQGMDTAYQMRRRLNPHHSAEDVAYEDRNVRKEQYERWIHIKDLYAANRDELANTLSDPHYEACKSIMEKIFTQELDDALRRVVDDEQ